MDYTIASVNKPSSVALNQNHVKHPYSYRTCRVIDGYDIFHHKQKLPKRLLFHKIKLI